MDRRYRAFISYSWSDKDWGRWLHQALETYRTPAALVGGETPIGPVPASLHPIFRDREEEAAGHGIGAAIEAAMAASEFLIVICSPRSAQSQWVNREVAWFKRHKDKTRILALVIDGEPGASFIPGRAAEECFPPTLLYEVDERLQPTDIREDAPLAADARAEGDGKRGAKLKLAAAMLGVGLDDLVRRDERRRTLRRRWAMSGMAAGMTALSGLSIYAFNQRDAAIAARNDAVSAREDAEEIIELILTDLKSDLEGFGTLKSVTAIGNRAIGYYEGQDVKALTPDQLGRRARVLLMLGEADNKRGNLDAALARYETAEATTSEQLARDPDNPQRMFDHAQSVFWVGYIAWQRGDRATAKTQFTEYHGLAQRLVAVDPANEDWQAELEYAYSNLGTLAMDDGESEVAEDWFRKALAISTTQLGKEPSSLDRILAAEQSYAWLSDALFANGDYAGAANIREKQYSIYIDKSGELMPGVDRSALTSLFSLAQAQFAIGDLDNAVANARRAAAGFKRLSGGDPENVELADVADFAHIVLAEGEFHTGLTKAASATLQPVLDRIEGGDLGATMRQSKFRAQAMLLQARLTSNEDVPAAVAILTTVADHLAKTLGDGGEDRDLLRRYCAALAYRARLNPNAGTDWREIVSLLAPRLRQLSPDAQVLLIEAQYRIGDKGAARDNAATLSSSGYRHPDFVALTMEFPDLLRRAER